MAKIKFIEIGMDDPMERLYYERRARRKKAYDAKRRRPLTKNSGRANTVCKMDGHGFSQASPVAI